MVQVITLSQAISTAEARHPDVQAADAQVEVAKSKADAAHAALEPEIDLSMRYDVSGHNSVLDGFTSAVGGQSYDFGISGGLLLWDFGKTKDKWRQADLGAAAQLASRDTTERGVVLDVELAYFDALAAKKLVAVAADTASAAQRHVDETSKFVGAGSRPEIDLAKVKSTLAQSRSALVKAQNDYAAARSRLSEAMGVAEQGGDFDVSDATESPSTVRTAARRRSSTTR
jgi:outer membrane protein